MAISKVVVVDGNNLTVRIDRGVAGRGVTDVEPVEIDNQLYLEFTFSDGTTETVGPVGTIQYIGESPIVIDGPTISLTTVPVTLGGTNATTAADARTNLNAANQDTTISAGTGLSGGGSLAANRTISIANTAVTAASYGSASKTLTATVNAQGQLTALADTPIAIANTQISGLGTMSTQNANAVAITGGSITGITDLAIADGGTGASTAADARTNLGLGTASTLNAGVALGVATLDAGGTVPLSQIPASIQGGVSYQGSWNAATNTPTIVSSVGSKGYYYVVSVAGSTNINGITDWLPGDWIIFNGSVWEQIDNTDTVQSVNGYVGAVVLTAADVGAPPTTRTITAGTGLSGGGDLSANRTIDIANTAVSAGSYGTASSVPSITVNAQGQLTAAANTTIAIVNTQVSGLGTMSTQNANAVAITGGTATLTSLTVNDNTTLGSSNTDQVNFNARIASEFTPSTANTYDLGRNSHEWRNLYLTGTANISALTASSTVTLSGGTANGVAYLNGSKVLTTGSALTFDGSTLTNTGVGYSVNNANALLRFGNAAATRTGYLQVRSDAFEVWSDQAAVPMVFGVNNTEQMRLTSTGLGIGTSSPTTKLYVTVSAASTACAAFFNTDTANGNGVYIKAGGANSGKYALAIENAAGASLAYLDSSGNLGIGTSSPAFKLSVQGNAIIGGSNPYLAFGSDASVGATPTYIERNGTTGLQTFYNNGTGTNGAMAFVIGAGSEAMRLTDTGLGIGTSSPAYKLDVLGTSRIYQSGNTAASLMLNANQGSLSTGYAFTLAQSNSSGNYNFTIAEGATTYLTLTNSISGAGGNLGLGVTPSAWGYAGNLQFVNGGAIGSINKFSHFVANAYFNSDWKYASTATSAARYTQNDGAHEWFTAPSGTAGDAISFTQAMTLDASGNLMVGTTSAGGRRLNVNGTVDQVASLATTATGAYSATAYNGANCGRFIIQGGSASGSGNGIVLTQGGSSELWFGQVQEAGGAGAFVWQGYNGSAYAERMRLDSSGNLGLGVTPSAWNADYKVEQIGSTSSFYGRVASAQTGIGENFYRDAGGTFRYITSNQVSRLELDSGAFYWYTAGSGTAGNAISFTQAMTLDASGNLNVGTTSNAGAIRLKVLGAASQYAGYFEYVNSGYGLGISNITDATSSTAVFFFNTNGAVGSINTNGSATTYTTSSDYRLKNITGPITTSGAYIDSLNPVEGTWKADGSTFVGLIAHEVQEASRTTVATGVKDGEEMQGMDYSSAEIIANLIAEVKALRTRVAALESI